MREFSLRILDFQLQKFKEIILNDIQKGYLTYNFSIVSIGVNFLDVIDFENYLVRTKIENDRLLHTIYKVSNDILDIYIDSEDKINFKEKEVIEKSLPSDWKIKLCDRAIAQVKAGFICLRVEEGKIRVYEEYYEIGAFNKIYVPNYDNHKNFISIITDIQLIRNLITEYFPTVREEYLKKYYPELIVGTEQIELESTSNNIFYSDIFKGNDSLNFFNIFLKRREEDDLFNSVSFLVKKMKEDGMIMRDVSYKSMVEFLEKADLIPMEYMKFNDNHSYNNKADSKIRKSLYTSLKEEFRK